MLLFCVRERLRTHSIESSGKLKISPEQHWDFTAEDLKDLGEIGRGAYGSVNKMVHKPSNQIMAVKVTEYHNKPLPSMLAGRADGMLGRLICVSSQRIRSTVDEKEQKQLLMDLDVVMRSSDCPYIVQFYGALFREVGSTPLGTLESLVCLIFLTFPSSVFQGDCWICMELMATSLDKFYKFVYCSLDEVIPEEILGKITLAVSVGDATSPDSQRACS